MPKLDVGLGRQNTEANAGTTSAIVEENSGTMFLRAWRTEGHNPVRLKNSDYCGCGCAK